MYEAIHWLYLNLADGNVNSFLPAWAAYRGIIATPNAMLTADQRKTHLGLSPHFIRLLRNHDAVGLEKELAIEQVRQRYFPNSISRLNCIYCWADEATARVAPMFWSSQGRHFDERYLVEIGVSAQKPPTIVDTRWIDKFVINSNTPLKQIGTDWIFEYWKGNKYPWDKERGIPEQPLMECLVDGTALIYGSELRMEAFALVKKLAPDSVAILEKGRLGVALTVEADLPDTWRLGQMLGILLSNKERTDLLITHVLCADETLAGIINERANTGFFQADKINHEALEILFDKDEFLLPNLTPINVNASWLHEHPTLEEKLNHVLTSFFVASGGDIGFQPR